MNEEGDLKRERERERSFKLSSQPTVGQILAPDDRQRKQGPGLPGIWQTQGLHEGPGQAMPALPHPSGVPALPAAGGSGLCDAHEVAYLGNVSHWETGQAF